MIEKIANNVSIKTHINYSISLRYYGLLVEMEFRNTQRIFTNTILKVEKSLLITSLLQGAQRYMQSSSYVY